jgi:hypothetical protein
MQPANDATQVIRVTGTDSESAGGASGEGASFAQHPAQLSEALTLIEGSGNKIDFDNWWRNAGEFLTQHEMGLRDLMQAAYVAGESRAGQQLDVSAVPAGGTCVPFEGHFTGVQHIDLGLQLYSDRSEGGLYEVVGQALGESGSAGLEVMVYRCQVTGSMLYRETEDFEGQMVLAPMCRQETQQ